MNSYIELAICHIAVQNGVGKNDNNVLIKYEQNTFHVVFFADHSICKKHVFSSFIGNNKKSTASKARNIRPILISIL